MSKRFWMFVTFAGALVFVAGLVLTIVLIDETGQVVDDSECDALGPVAAADIQLASCVTSDDPKVLAGVAVLMFGGAMVGIGIWRWIATAQSEPGGGGGLLGSLQSLQDKAQAMQEQAMQSGTMSAGTAPPAPPPAEPPPEA